MRKDKKVSGLICEFNPLHNGHEYILKKMRENSEYIVCVMSGNFVQRGDVAVIDKWKRAEAALNSGADLIIELPVWNSVSTAEKFAFTSCHILNSLGVADNIYFGSECGDIEILKKCAEILENNELKARISENKNEGITFARVRENAVNELYGENLSDIFKESNNILAIEYIKALNKLNSSIEPITIKRHLAGHNEGIVENFASATKVRELIKNNCDFSPFIPDAMKKNITDTADIKNLERAILTYLRSINENKILNVPDVNEGLHNKIIEASNESTTLDELYMNIKSKRYSLARIRRIVLSAFLDITDDLPLEGIYIRILGMNKKGEEILKEKKNTIPFILTYSDAKRNCLEKYFEFEAKCDSIYALAKNIPGKGNDYFKRRIIKK